MVASEEETEGSAKKRRLPILVTVLITTVLAVAIFVAATFLLTEILQFSAPGSVSTPSSTPNAPAASSSQELTRSEQLDVVRLALTIVAGMGGIVALVVAYRRQDITEEAHLRQLHVDHHNEYDARERRITELYAQAITQLANDRAHVRVGGMYALERLAQENAAHRQTVVNVLCAYLRTPIVLTPRILEAFSPMRSFDNSTTDESPGPDVENRLIEELHARFAAQRILFRHFRSDINQLPAYEKRLHHEKPTNTDFWPGVRLDLSDAHLIHPDVSLCYFENADFTRIKLSGMSDFAASYFASNVMFDHATIDEGFFNSVEFAASVRFVNAKFGHWATFDNAKFGAEGTFNAAEFSGVVAFRGVQWASDPASNWAVLGAAAHVNLEFNGVRSWPPGWQLRIRRDQPNIGVCELIADPHPLGDDDIIEPFR